MTHPTSEILLSHVSGNLKGPFSVLIGSHVALCPSCRDEQRRLEALGGALFDDLVAEGPADRGLAATLTRLDEPPPQVSASAADADPETVRRLPAPLRRFIGTPIAALPWKQVIRGLSVVEFATPATDGMRVQLLLSRPGQSLPRHRHHGTEMTLVLSGGLNVDSAHYGRGDVMVVEPGEVHHPVAEGGEDCLSFAVADGPLRFTALVPRLWQIVTRY